MTDKPAIDWLEESKRFDGVAEAYDRYRPTYPQELVESILSLTHLPPSGNLLEIGCGTGQATRLFAQRGYAVHCIEPGKNLAQVAAERLRDFPQVRFEHIRFEEWPEREGMFDLVFSAQAFHWVPPAVGYRKIALALKPAGHLALFWNMYPGGITGELAAALDRVYQERAPELNRLQEEKNEEVIQQRAQAIAESRYFGPVSIKRFPWSVRYTTQDYLGLLTTYSDHIRLGAQTRQHLLAGVAEVIDQFGGYIERPYLAVLYVAPRLI